MSMAEIQQLENQGVRDLREQMADTSGVTKLGKIMQQPMVLASSTRHVVVLRRHHRIFPQIRQAFT